MAIKKALVQPGQYSGFTVTLDGVDVTAIIVECNVYQDIFSPTWTANLIISDAENIMHTEQIAVGSTAKISIETDIKVEPCNGTTSKDFEFIIYSISDRTLVRKSMYGYVVKLVSKNAAQDLKTRISKYYGKSTPNALVGKVLQDGGVGSLGISDEDPIKYDVIIPNWTPFTAANWAASFAKNPEGGADFLFYQINESSYAFRSLEKIMKEQPIHTFIHKEVNYRKNSHKEDEDAFIKMIRYKFLTNVDGLKNLALGFFGNTMVAHDIINKTIVKTPYSYSQDITDDELLKPWKGSFFEGSLDTVHSMTTLHEGMTPKAPSPNDTHPQWRGSRRSHQLKLETNRLIFEIPGSACLWQALGKPIEILLPPQEDKSKRELDQYYKGTYVVYAIKHTITKENYWITIEAGKKRLDKPIGG